MQVTEPTGAMRMAIHACRRHMLAAAGFSALVNILYIAPTLFMLQVYDRVVPTRGLLTLLFVTIVLLFALVTLSFLDRIRARLLIRASVKFDAMLAPAILDATLGQPNLSVARQALREFDGIRAAFSGQPILAVFDAPWVPIYILVCFLVHPWIGATAFAGCLILPAITFANERMIRSRLDRAQGIASASYANQDVVIGSADTVRALGMRRAMVERQMRLRSAMTIAQTEAGLGASGFLAATKFLRLALQSLTLGLGAWLAVDNLISGGAIFAASFLIARSLAPIEQLIGNWRTLVQARQSYLNLETLLSAVSTKPLGTRLPPPTGRLALEGVTVLDEGCERAILNAVSFTVKPGEVVAIVGPSGAGKSTLVQVIAGALRPDQGTVRIDGADARDWDPERLARHIGYLPQDSVLFAGTIAENIARFTGEIDGDHTAIDAAVIAAAQKVGAEPLIQRLSNGYDHVLKLGGRGVSAGQAQRIGLARAVYGAPKLLILDEPNAHLDAEGDKALITAMSALKAEKCTILIVSHKLSILPVIDKVLVLRDGQVKLFGPHDEVLPKIASPQIRQKSPVVVADA